jgi:uncharacterized membrane protein YbhN (UPF0104 family)
MSTELNLFVLIIEVILLTTVLYAVGHFFVDQEEDYFIVKRYYKKDVFRKILTCTLVSVVILAVLHIIAYLCIWILTMNGIEASSIHEAELMMLLRC